MPLIGGGTDSKVKYVVSSVRHGIVDDFYGYVDTYNDGSIHTHGISHIGWYPSGVLYPECTVDTYGAALKPIRGFPNSGGYNTCSTQGSNSTSSYIWIGGKEGNKIRGSWVNKGDQTSFAPKTYSVALSLDAWWYPEST